MAGAPHLRSTGMTTPHRNVDGSARACGTSRPSCSARSCSTSSSSSTDSVRNGINSSRVRSGPRAFAGRAARHVMSSTLAEAATHQSSPAASHCSIAS